MERSKDSLKGYWIGCAVCCFLLAGFGGISLVVWTPDLTAFLTTGTFLALFVASGILYLLRWRGMVKMMLVVMSVFFLGVFLYWWKTNQFIGVMPALLATLIVWQNGRLEKGLKSF
jgi:hypothetical protein